MPKNKTQEIPTIKNTFFAEAADKTAIKFAGILKSMTDKETPTGTAKEFKGDFLLEIGDDTFRAGKAFFPASIRDPLQSAILKAGKWESLEMVFTAVKDGASSNWKVTFVLAPRIEQDRVISLLALT